jgi:hypothetical protein
MPQVDISDRLREFVDTLRTLADKSTAEGLDVDDKSTLMTIIAELEEYVENFGVLTDNRMMIRQFILPSAQNLLKYGVSG